ncbi:hypothetical protein UFOVP566_1 [uncultured Caudovirales phage]|uniref:Uncharacterized protein n=1 Tax=uncultured Caudovirales phage TaxID=2100421 RepID=A0A6J5LSP3_9CAUD|nr:hypothetical protein UFOVP294_9 [uncultured Caudovirales phage]CAB4150177.1 hypothetical protein UFOVP566_1 [uncultured Caudovirales phage]
MSYTSGNKAPTLMAQMPNRVGNKSTNVHSHTSGVTAVTGKLGGLMQPAGNQGAPKAGGSITGIHQKVMLSKPKGYDGACHNDGYMKNSSYTK